MADTSMFFQIVFFVDPSQPLFLFSFAPIKQVLNKKSAGFEFRSSNSVTRKKSPIVYKSCPKMISLEK